MVRPHPCPLGSGTTGRERKCTRPSIWRTGGDTDPAAEGCHSSANSPVLIHSSSFVVQISEGFGPQAHPSGRSGRQQRGRRTTQRMVGQHPAMPRHERLAIRHYLGGRTCAEHAVVAQWQSPRLPSGPCRFESGQPFCLAGVPGRARTPPGAGLVPRARGARRANRCGNSAGPRLAAVAHLAERILRTDEARGSSPRGGSWGEARVPVVQLVNSGPYSRSRFES